MSNFQKLLNQYKKDAFSKRDQGFKFEQLILGYLKTAPEYKTEIDQVFMWNDFPAKNQFGGQDSGIDLVARTYGGEYWAVQCKFYTKNYIDKKDLDGFLATSSRKFKDSNENGKEIQFSQRLFFSTTNDWTAKAEETIKNQAIPVIRIDLSHLEQANVDWEKLAKGLSGEKARGKKKSLLEHQKEALEKTKEYFTKKDRGKLIMACGTGKTFTSLKIAENETKGNGLLLFLVPSIALLSQTLREWMAESDTPIYPLPICSDPGVSQKKQRNNDDLLESVVNLAFPASTNVESILRNFTKLKSQQKENGGMLVVFSTYQSIDVIIEAQKKLIQTNESAQFDLIICDEAHRTTGISRSNSEKDKKEASYFTKVHDNQLIKAKKRLYMTATPRLYDENSKKKAEQKNIILCSMDDKSLYGEQIYRIGFGEAVEKGLLTDYKVLVLTMNKEKVPLEVQEALAKENSQINTDDYSKLVGCMNAISKNVVGIEKEFLDKPMKKVVAFCQKINDSKKISKVFNKMHESNQLSNVSPIQSDHIDGSMNAPKRDELLNWLKREDENDTCKILTNVRCLSEGVDVPSLDGIFFLSAKNSQVDVVQSVGRVMRKAPNKKWGYIVIPVVVSEREVASEALDDNKEYKVIWSVLSALRSHDERLNIMTNQINLNQRTPNIGVGTIGGSEGDFYGDSSGTDQSQKEALEKQLSLLNFEELQPIFYAKLVEKVGDRDYWENWAKDVGQIAQQEIARIENLVIKESDEQKIFQKFHSDLKKNINPSISEKQTIEMLSQHLITKPVFEALFEGYSFVENNSVSKSMQKIIDSLKTGKDNPYLEKLDKFYESVKKRVQNIDNAQGRQRVIIELYEQFFKTAFPLMVEQLGIVYTPVEVVDFIIHSVDDLLRQEFNSRLSDKNVHILDPFTGTGTFITRLIESGLIKPEDLKRKYTKEIHANEIVLLAYYIAAINIENAYHYAQNAPSSNSQDFESFKRIVLTDTFQTTEQGNPGQTQNYFEENSQKVESQKNAPIQVIIGNPPYSVGQKSANDNAQNQKYPRLDQKISQTYAEKGNAQNKNSLSDSYIKAFRWATDRINEQKQGIIMFVTNNGWINSNAMDGFRKSIEEDFDKIYIFNLRGDQRTSGELSRKEGGKIFGSGSRAGISVTALIKNCPDDSSQKPSQKPFKKQKKAKIHYYDIGDYLNQQQKLEKITELKSIQTLIDHKKLKILKPNQHQDWINQRNPVFEKFIPLAPPKKGDKNTNSFFTLNSLGVTSARDAWVYHFSKKKLQKNIQKTMAHFNEQMALFEKGQIKEPQIDPKKGTWPNSWKSQFKAQKMIREDGREYRKSIYRPFVKSNLYFEKDLIHRRYQLPKIFPSKGIPNKVICIHGLGGKKDFSAYISHEIPDLHILDSSTQCFPLYFYQKKGDFEKLFDQTQHFKFDSPQNSSKNEKIQVEEYVRKDGISDFILKEAQKKYKTDQIKKEEIFTYVYGILHSKDYRDTFQNSLKKVLARIPLVKSYQNFQKFSQSGAKLATLHGDYENLDYKSTKIYKSLQIIPFDATATTPASQKGIYRVEKMRFEAQGKSSIIYNEHISIKNIPPKAYEYVVNGKSAIEWVVEKYQPTIHKESQIANNPNDWAEEQNDPSYILDLLLKVIVLSVQTIEIVENFPKISFEES